MPSENDASGRRHLRADLDLYVNKIIGDEPHLSRVRNISAGGVYLYKLLEPEVPPGTHVGLEMKLPDSRNIIWAVGRVVREEEADRADAVAVRFVRIAEADRDRIRRFVAKELAA